MHWFWRSTLALVVGGLCQVVLFFIILKIMSTRSNMENKYILAASHLEL